MGNRTQSSDLGCWRNRRAGSCRLECTTWLSRLSQPFAICFRRCSSSAVLRGPRPHQRHFIDLSRSSSKLLNSLGRLHSCIPSASGYGHSENYSSYYVGINLEEEEETPSKGGGLEVPFLCLWGRKLCGSNCSPSLRERQKQSPCWKWGLLLRQCWCSVNLVFLEVGCRKARAEYC